MPLNLITDPWICATRDTTPVTLRPDQIAEERGTRLDWPRDDLNLACVELLVGLLFLADPPRDDGDWHERYSTPDPDRLRTALAPFAPHFELTGDGPRFLQDRDRFEAGTKGGDIKSPEMLFIDSAGKKTVSNNADLMVKRERYTVLPLPHAAIALYTLQAFAPSGGAGNRTSMRGGGPMVTLVQPLDSGAYPLWRLVWCNVPEGVPLPADRAAEALPWMRRTRTSKDDETVTPEMSHLGEAFFGMPRRLRLLFDGDVMTGFIQKPHGTNYKLWQHPLSPYYRQKPGAELLPVHPKPGKVSYRNWLGLAFGQGGETRAVAASVSRFHSLSNAPDAELRVGGWAMDNMKPMDFDLHIYPTFQLGETAELRVAELVSAANSAANQLIMALNRVMAMKGRTSESMREAFFSDTEAKFITAMRAITDARGQEIEQEIKEGWLATLRRTTLALFDRHAAPSLPDRDLSDIEAAVKARRALLAFFTKPMGIRKALSLPAREKETTA